MSKIHNFRHLPSKIAVSYLRKRMIQNIICISGISIGVMVLIISLSLTNGFATALIQATLRATPELTILRLNSNSIDKGIEHYLQNNTRVVSWMPFLAIKGIIVKPTTKYSSKTFDFANLFGVTEKANQIYSLRQSQNLDFSSLKNGSIILGSTLAQNLNVVLGSRIQVFNSSQKYIEVKLVGIFRSGNYIIDSTYAFTNIKTLQDLSNTNYITGYQIRLNTPDLAPKEGNLISQNYPYSSVPWQQLYSSLIDQLSLQKKVIGIVVFLIVLVASLGIANVLTLMVFEKTQDIAILRAIGTSRQQIILAFIIQGAVLGGLGLAIGDVLAIILDIYFKIQPIQIPGDLYFITEIPVEIHPVDVLWVNTVCLITALLSGLIPARRAADIEPAHIIR